MGSTWEASGQRGRGPRRAAAPSIPSISRRRWPRAEPLIPIAAIPPPAARRLGLLRNFAASSASTVCRLVGSLVGTARELTDCPAISMGDGGHSLRHMAIFVAAIGFWAKHTRSRASSLAALPVISWRLRLVRVMAGSGALLLKQSFELV